MSLKVSRTEPVQEPVTLAEIKQALSIDYDDWDSFLNTLNTAARQTVEEISGQLLAPVTVSIVGNKDTARIYPFQPVTADAPEADGIVTYDYEAGYSDCPGWAKRAILQSVASGWLYREDSTQVAVNKVTETAAGLARLNKIQLL